MPVEHLTTVVRLQMPGARSKTKEKKMSKITKDMLQEINACKEGRDAFALLFPSGATWDAVVAAATTPLHQEWLAWLGRVCPADVPGATPEARAGAQCLLKPQPLRG